jgi:predicted glycoside hydrolase/deacetylase ChbG (UPF0249 family)
MGCLPVSIASIRRSWKLLRSAAIVLVAILVQAGTWLPIEVRAETWAERLEYPSNAKVIILHAHELGLCHEANAAGVRLLGTGGLVSGAAMAPSPWFADFVEQTAPMPQADLGLELTINSEWKNYRWRPVASDALVASLLDPDRFLWQSTTQTMVNGEANDVERELLAQIAYAKSLGLKPTHLTTHLGALVTRPDLIEVYLRVARQQWIPAMMVEVTPQQLERFRAAGYPIPDEIVALLADYPLPKVDDLQIIGPAESYPAKKSAFLKLLGEMPPGLVQVSLHPAVESDSLKRIAADWQQRVWELQLLADEDVRTALHSPGVVLTTWREIMDRFQGRQPQADATPPAESNH